MNQPVALMAACEARASKSPLVAAARRPSRVNAIDRGALDPELEVQLRRHCFCMASEASRYRVSVDDVIAHLIGAGLSMTPRPQRSLAHVPDVMLAVACVRGDATAWNDLLNAHAWCLDRACAEQLGTSEGLTFARRFWGELRLTTRDLTRALKIAPRLQQYAGVRPIRLWLADRMLGAAATGAAASMARSPRLLDSAMGSRTLPIPAGHHGGTAT